MREDSKASVCSAYTTGNHAKQTVFSYRVSRAVVTSFPHTKSDTTLVCLSLRLVYQRETVCFLQFQLREAIFFPTSRNKNAFNYLSCNLIGLLKSCSTAQTLCANHTRPFLLYAKGVCMYVHTYIHTYIHTYMYIHTCIHTCTCTYTIMLINSSC